ncbi:hypothetical protein MG296_01335 [Flavobacteriaceae bacterium TK19130]|nr:hypothetical protein [Thermobacterium salinum]
MKKNTLLLVYLLGIATIPTTYAQVGIGTTAPKGILDIESSQHGVVYPSVALTDTNVEAPVINPQGGSLAVGTTVYNTNATSTGTNDVEPGIYSWSGTKWIPHFYVKQYEYYVQTSTLRTSSSSGYQMVPGLDADSFTPLYSGVYRIYIKAFYGGGNVIQNGDIEAVTATGTFRFNWDGTPHTFDVKAYSAYNANVGGGIVMSNKWIETTKVIYMNLIAGVTYNFNLEFDQTSTTGFEANGNLSGGNDGRGYVGSDLPCTIEISFVDEN